VYERKIYPFSKNLWLPSLALSDYQSHLQKPYALARVQPFGVYKRNIAKE